MAEPKYVTLVANTAQPVTLERDWNVVEVAVVSTDGSPVYARADGVAAAVETDGNTFIPPAVGAYVLLKVAGSGNTVVSLRSAGVSKVTVRGVS